MENNATNKSNLTKQNFLDEKDPVWYKLAKGFLVVTSILIVIAGIISFFSATANYYEGMALIISTWPILLGVTEYVFGMVILNHINNVNIIRDLMEKNNKE